MKMMLLIAILLTVGLIGRNSLYSETTSGGRTYGSLKNRILSNDMYKLDRLYQMQDANEFLSFEERIGLYKTYENTGGTTMLGFMFNMFIPGFGSLLIKDFWGGLVTFVGVGGGIVGIMAASAYRPNIPNPGFDASDEERLQYSIAWTTFRNTQYVLVFSFISLSVTSYLHGLISPFYYVSAHNDKLALALKLRKSEIEQYGNKKDIVVPVVFNILVGMGVGSFAQGDTLGGVIGLTGELTGMICSFVNFIMAYQITMWELPVAMATMTNYNEVNGRLQLHNTLFVSGIVLFAATKIFEIVRPITYAADYNKNVKTALMSREHPVAFQPYVAPAPFENGMEWRMGLNTSVAF